MTAREPVTSCHGCPPYTGKHCGHAVLYGPGACWRRDGRPERKAGLSGEGWRSPFEGKEEVGE